MQKTALSLVLSSFFLFSGCKENDSTTNKEYEITVTNLTAGQPFAPIGVVLHSSGYLPFNVGDAASVGLEKMAEGGDLNTFISDANTSANVSAVNKGSTLTLPGESKSITITSSSATKLSLVAMMANTNDGFIGLEGADIHKMNKGEEREFYLNAYDAGTEANSETASTIPGPAGGGEGFNAARNDNNFVTLHAGVVTSDDELATSVLKSIHKWDNPTAIVKIRRTK